MVEWKSRLAILLILAVAIAVAIGNLSSLNVGWIHNVGW